MADTINTGTMLIEEDALMPESLRFEGEPWTRFYMAGEIIRESQKASGKQSHYASEGNTAHSDEMIDHYNHQRNVGSQPKDDPNGGISLVGRRSKETLAIKNTNIVREFSLPPVQSCSMAQDARLDETIDHCRREEIPNGRDNQYGNHPFQGWDILAGRAAIR
jgi:hypothetical protein